MIKRPKKSAQDLETEFMAKVQKEISDVLAKHNCGIVPNALLTPQGIKWNLVLVRNSNAPS